MATAELLQEDQLQFPQSESAINIISEATKEANILVADCIEEETQASVEVVVEQQDHSTSHSGKPNGNVTKEDHCEDAGAVQLQVLNVFDIEGAKSNDNNGNSYRINDQINVRTLPEEKGDESQNIVLRCGDVVYNVTVDSTKDHQMHNENQSDRLTDSNSSDKMSPPHDFDDNDGEIIGSDDVQTASVPINFPIKGKILARFRLQSKGLEYFMTKSRMVIGRNSSKGAVDIDIGHSSFISRNHITIVHESNNFYLSCGGKNGVFVNDTLQKIGAPRMALPKSCALRFPSTQIVIQFDAAECFIDEYSTTNPKAVDNFAGVLPAPKSLRALSVKIPENGSNTKLHSRPLIKPFFSPCPSPSGTISAVNSCPTSPTSALVFSKKAVTGTGGSQSSLLHRYVTDPVTAKDNRIPVIDEEDMKPPYSYAQLIVQAISSTPDKQMTLSGIYAYISRNYQYYRANEKGWQNSIRHNLSLNRYFVKVARSLDEPGKGSFWSIDPVSEPKLVSQAFRRRNKRGIPYFRGTPHSSSAMTTQSCPASPINIAFYPQDAALSSATNVGVTHTSLANLTNQVVTIATVNSVAEAITMQSKHPQVIDISNIRNIQSAPGSPQGYKVLSPASLIAHKVLPKGTASVIGSKASGITLLQPITALTSVPTATGKPGQPVVALSSQQAQLLKSTNTLSSLATIPVTSLPATTQLAGGNTDVVNTILSTQPQTAGTKRPILIHFTSKPLASAGTIDEASAEATDGATAAKVAKQEES